MNFSMDYDNYGQRDLFVADAEVSERVAFIRRVYAHVGGATAFCVALIAIILNTPSIIQPLVGVFAGQFWMFFIAFFIASTAAHKMAEAKANPGLQYAGLGFYAFAEALLLAPMLWIIKTHFGGDAVIMQAAIFTLMIFGGLTMFVLVTKSDFSFMRNFLAIASFAVLGLIVVLFLTPLSLGTWFAGGMVLLMSGFILWETSNVLHHYQTDQHVAASLAIFSSLATLFWYVLQLSAALSSD